MLVRCAIVGRGVCVILSFFRSSPGTGLDLKDTYVFAKLTRKILIIYNL